MTDKGRKQSNGRVEGGREGEIIERMEDGEEGGEGERRVAWTEKEIGR